jgi:protein-disulfide isomerase
MLDVMNEYPNDVRWVFRHAPIPQLHPNAPAIANAAECAAAQGKFWEFTDNIFAESPSNVGIKLDELGMYAQKAGVADGAAFQSCIDSGEFDAKVQADFDDGIAAGPEQFGTPFNMVITADGNKQQLGGGIPFAQLKPIIDSLL